jgi:AcrR family transcriptional regulator
MTSEANLKIVAAARRLLARDGVGFDTSALARASGISRSTLYRRFAEDVALAREVHAIRCGDVVSARDTLLAAGAALLEEKGLAALTLRDVAVRAEVSSATLYRHFADRDVFVRALVREVIAPGQISELIAPHRPLKETLVCFVEAMQTRLRTRRSLLRILINTDPHDLRQLHGLRRAEERLSQGLAEFFARDDIRGQLRDAPTSHFVAALMGQILGAEMLAKLHDDAAVPDATEIVNQFLYGAQRQTP